MIIVIDPAHTGESDLGMFVDGVTEADVVLNVARAARDCLAGTPGLTVRLTREVNADPVLPWSPPADAAARARTVAGSGADAVVTIHAHAGGLEIRHAGGGLGLAQALHRRLGPLVGRHRGVVPADAPPIPGVRCKAVYVDIGAVSDDATWAAATGGAVADAIRDAFALPLPTAKTVGKVDAVAVSKPPRARSRQQKDGGE